MPAPVLRSVLETVVENITKKGNNIALTDLGRTLNRFGVKEQETEASQIIKFANEIAAKRNKVNKQGNLVITPEDLSKAEAQRTDVFKEATTKLDPRSITDEEGFFIESPAAQIAHPDHIEERQGVIDYAVDEIRHNLPFRMSPKEEYANRLEMLEDLVENAKEYGLRQDQTEDAAKQLADLRKFLEDPNSVDMNAGMSNLVLDPPTEGRFKQVMDEYEFAAGSDLKDEDYEKWLKRIEEIVEEDLVAEGKIVPLDIEAQHLALGEESLFATIALHDLDKLAYRVTLYEHPALSGKYRGLVGSKYFKDIEKKRDILESFHIRADQTTDTVFGGEVAARVFEIQSSSRTNEAWAIKNKLSSTTGGPLPSSPSAWNAPDPERLEKLEPDTSIWKNAVYQELARARDKGITEVQFLIEPGALDGMGWTERVQEGYKKILARVVMNAARKIDARIAWKGGKEITPEEMAALPSHLQDSIDLDDSNMWKDNIDKTSKYLVVGLPAAAFTLPLYAEENKEESFMATAISLGLSEEEAREYLEQRTVDDLEKLEDTKPTNNLNREGRVR